MLGNIPKYSSNKGRKLVDIAQDIIEHKSSLSTVIKANRM